MRVISVLVGLLCLEIAMAQSVRNLVRNPRFVEEKGAWTLKGGATYEANGMSLPRSGARVTQLVNIDKGGRGVMILRTGGDTGSLRVRLFQGTSKLDDDETRAGEEHVIFLFPDNSGKKVRVVLDAIEEDGVSNLVVQEVYLEINIFIYPLANEEYIRNGGFENAGSRNSWRLAGGASYNGAIAAAGSRSMKMKGVSSLTQTFSLDIFPHVLTCKVRGKARLMNLSLGNLAETDERRSFIDQSKSPWKRWAKLYGPAGSQVDVVVESSAGGFGYVDDCSLREFESRPTEGSVVGGAGTVFTEPLTGNQWIRNGGLEAGFRDWIAYVRTPFGGFDDGYDDEIRLSLFGANEGPRSGVFSAYMKAQVYLYQQFELPTSSDFLLICDVTDSTQKGGVFFHLNGEGDGDQVLGNTQVGNMNRFGKRKSRFEFSTGPDTGFYAVGIRQGLDSNGYVDNCSLKQL